MHSCLSNQLASLYTLARMQSKWRGDTSFNRVPVFGSNTLPCQAMKCTTLEAISANSVPGATMTVPRPSPVGMSPAGLDVKSSSSCSCDMSSISSTDGMCDLLSCEQDRDQRLPAVFQGAKALRFPVRARDSSG